MRWSLGRHALPRRPAACRGSAGAFQLQPHLGRKALAKSAQASSAQAGWRWPITHHQQLHATAAARRQLRPGGAAWSCARAGLRAAGWTTGPGSRLTIRRRRCLNFGRGLLGRSRLAADAGLPARRLGGPLPGAFADRLAGTFTRLRPAAGRPATVRLALGLGRQVHRLAGLGQPPVPFSPIFSLTALPPQISSRW